MAASRRFTLLRELGSGAFGTVYLAEMESMGGFKKQVAVKLLNAELSNFTDASKRLRDEARMLGRLQHRNIVRVDDLLRLDGRWAIVMEHVQGCDVELLMQALESMEETFSPVAALETISAVCAALDAAWSSAAGGAQPLHVVHRDIKPSNIRLTFTGEVKVLDFGIARAEFAEREAKTEQIRYGSIGYLSPERLLGEPEVPAGDVFAAGCVLYELLVGEALGRVELSPSAHVTQMEEVVSRTRAALEGQDPKTVDSLVELLISCLAYEVSERPSAAQVASRLLELSRALEGEDLRGFCTRALPGLAQVFDDGTRPARGVLTEEGLSTTGSPVQKVVSNPTLVFDGFDELAEDVPVAAPGPTGLTQEQPAPAPEPQQEPEQEDGSTGALPWLLGGLVLLLVGGSVAWIASQGPSASLEEPTVTEQTEVAPPDQVEPALLGVEPDPIPELPVVETEPVETEPVDAETLTAPVAPREVAPKVREKDPEEPVGSVEQSPVTRLRSAKFSVPGASSVKVRCGDVSGSGSASALLRELPAGACSVTATVDGASLKGQVNVSKPTGITCTPTEGSLVCR